MGSSPTPGTFMNSIKGVIFDFNGVLIVDTELHYEAWSQTSLKLRGYPLSRKEESDMRGRTNRDVFEYVLGREISKEELESLTEEKESIYRNMCLELGEKFKLSQGAIELFEHLSHKNIPFTIATSSEKNNLLFFFKYLHLDTWFKFDLVAYNDGTMASKPAPDIYLRASEKIRLAPAQCLVIEDALAGIRSAHSAGIGYIVALGPKEEHPALLQLEGVRLAIENLGELVETGPLAK